MEEEAKPAQAPLRRGPSLGLNLGLLGLAGAWLAVIARNGETRVERWLAAAALALVGLTGLSGWARHRLTLRRERPRAREGR